MIQTEQLSPGWRCLLSQNFSKSSEPKVNLVKPKRRSKPHKRAIKQLKLLLITLLGYIVKSGSTVMRGVDFFFLKVQSSTRSPSYVADKIDEFVYNTLRQELLAVDEKTFLGIRDGLISNYSQKYKNHTEVLNLCVGQILTRNYEYQIRENYIKELKELKLEDCIGLFNTIFVDEAKKRVLEIHLTAIQHKEDDLEWGKKREERCFGEGSVNSGSELVYFDESDALKKRLGLYPDYYSIDYDHECLEE